MKKKAVSLVFVVTLIAMLMSGCTGGSKKDVTHDPNGFLGYSDSFWEWYAKNN